jgi:hypothetical protein
MSAPAAGFLRDFVVWTYTGFDLSSFTVTSRFAGIYVPAAGPGYEWMRDWMYRWLRDREVPPWHRTICSGYDVPAYGATRALAAAVATALGVTYTSNDDGDAICALICTAKGWEEPPPYPADDE